MRTCAKMRCESRAAATVGLRYDEREVFVGELTSSPDRNLLDLCEEHVRTLSPPRGWRVRDDRNVVVLPDAGRAVPEPLAEDPAPTVPGRSSPSAAETA